jgi:DNA-binding transcriptional regulator YdaS (Cro superfamily)
MLESVDEVIEALGGTQRSAEQLGVLPTAVSNWKARGKIPSDKFLVISGALRERGKKVSSTIFGFSEQPEAAR